MKELKRVYLDDTKYSISHDYDKYYVFSLETKDVTTSFEQVFMDDENALKEFNRRYSEVKQTCYKNNCSNCIYKDVCSDKNCMESILL